MNNLLAQIENIKNSEVKQLIDFRIKQFKSQQDIFSELCFCILTANFRADKSIEIQQKLRRAFLELDERKLAKKLSKFGHRFPNTRAKFICEARNKKPELMRALRTFKGDDLRNWIVKNIKGIGMKEASHFLRNIGYDDFAIIDFHILDLLVKNGLIQKPKALNKSTYLEIESILREISIKTQLTPAELDLYLWYLETNKVLK